MIYKNCQLSLGIWIKNKIIINIKYVINKYNKYYKLTVTWDLDYFLMKWRK